MLRSLDEGEAKKVLSEVHDGICGNHIGGQSLAYKVLRWGYYWPNLRRKQLNMQRNAKATKGTPSSLDNIRRI